MRILVAIGVGAVLGMGCATELSSPPERIPGVLSDGTYALEWHLAGKQPTAIPPPDLVDLRTFILSDDRLEMDTEASCVSCVASMAIVQRDDHCAAIAGDEPRQPFEVCVVDNAGTAIGTLTWKFADASWQTWWFVATPTP